MWTALQPNTVELALIAAETRSCDTSVPRHVALVSIYGCHWSYPTSVFFMDSTNMQRLNGEVPGQAVNRRTDFESTCLSSILFVVTGAGPSPIGRPFAELPTDRVLVDGGNRSRARTGGRRSPPQALVEYDQWHPEMITSANRRST